MYANKLDKDDYFTSEEVIKKLGTAQLKDRTWFFQGCCCITGEGVKSGFDWIVTNIAKKK